MGRISRSKQNQAGKKKKKPAPKPKKPKHPEDIKEDQIKSYIENKPKGGYSRDNTKDPGPGRGRDGKKRKAPLWRDRLRSGYYIPRIPQINTAGLEELGRYGKDISDKASSGSSAGGDVGGQDSAETKKLRQSGASFGARYIGAFDEQDTEDAAGRK